MKTLHQSEKSITKDIRGWLKLKGVFHWKVMQGLGCTPGVPDIIGIYKERFLAIEVKTMKGKLSKHQEYFRDRIIDEGGLYILARSLDDVLLELDPKYKEQQF